MLESLIALFEKAGQAHHQAFLATNGADLEWPLWYADYLHSPLIGLLTVQITKSELVYLLVHMDREHRASAPDAYWPRYYASFLLERYP